MSAPSLRFTDNGIPYPDAISIPVSEIGILYGGLSGKSAPDFGHGLPFVTYKQVFDCAEIDLTSCGQVSISSGERQNCIALGDVLFTSSSETPKEVGYASVVTTEPEETYLNSFCFGLRPKPTTLVPAYSRYLFHAQEYREQVETLAQGTTRYNISKKGFLKINLTIPTLPEQRRIADALSVVDAKIDLLARKRDNLARFKTGLMQKIFSQEVRFTRDDGSAYPDWEEKKIKELGSFKGGGTPSTKNPAFWNGAIPWVSSQDVTDGDINRLVATRFITMEAVASSPTALIPANSVLLVTRVGVGKVALNRTDVCLSQDFTAIIPSGVNAEFLAYWFQYHAPQIASLAQGSTIKGVTVETLRDMTVSLPVDTEQDQIAASLAALDSRISGVTCQIATMQAFKKGLLQQMFV